MTGNAQDERWLGIDFSGNIQMWKPGCRTSNVWIAEICKSSLPKNLYYLTDLKRIQELPGSEPPFLRLARFLAKREFAACAIDAPFSVPAEFVPAGGQKSLLAEVGSLVDGRRPFPDGRLFVALVTSTRKLARKKPLRTTEDEWLRKKVNIRSTLWAGARGGAPMTAACLTLLHLSSCPMWPWTLGGPGLLIEAFPAGQLKHWDLPFQQYSGRTDIHCANRRMILNGLRRRVDLGAWEEILLPCADAIDAVVCALTAAAVTHGSVAIAPDASISDREGWIAISPLS